MCEVREDSKSSLFIGSMNILHLILMNDEYYTNIVSVYQSIAYHRIVLYVDCSPCCMLIVFLFVHFTTEP